MFYKLQMAAINQNTNKYFFSTAAKIFMCEQNIHRSELYVEPNLSKSV